MITWSQNIKKTTTIYCMDTGSFRIYILHKSKRHLCGHCKRFPNSTLYFKLWIRKTITWRKEEVIWLMKAKIVGKIMTKFATLRPKTYRYLTDDNVENKKAKTTEKCVINESVSWMISACNSSRMAYLKSLQDLIGFYRKFSQTISNRIFLSCNVTSFHVTLLLETLCF